jgi:hypothetical protein
VIAFGVGQAEHPLFQEGILAVPQREAEAEMKLLVAEAADAVLAPTVGAAAGVLVREVRPGIALLAIVLADRAPLALAEIWSPAAPATLVRLRLREPAALGGLEQARRALRHRFAAWRRLIQWSFLRPCDDDCNGLGLLKKS